MSLYWGKSFLGFIALFCSRFLVLFQGSEGLQSDEIQVFVLSLISIMCAFIGVFLVVRKMTMVANAISHTVLIGIVIAVIFAHYFYGADISVMGSEIHPMILIAAAIITSVMTLALIELLSTKLHVQNDVSIGLVFTFLFAVGVVLATIFTRNAHIGTEVIMGNIDLITTGDLKTVFYLTLFIWVIMSFFFRAFLISSFDEQFASISGITVRALNYLLVLLASLSVIVAMRAVGVILVLAFLVVPVLTARLFFHSMKLLILGSTVIGIVSSFISVALSRHFLSTEEIPLSTSGLVVTILFFFWILGVLISPKKGLIKKFKQKNDSQNGAKIDFSKAD